MRVVASTELTPLDAAYAQGLGTGEVAVLAYALLHGLVALIDERRARAVAQRLAVSVIGSGAVLVALRRAGRIDDLSSVFDAWTRHGYFVSERVRQEIELGLKTLVQLERQRAIKGLRGKVRWQWDVQAMRRDER